MAAEVLLPKLGMNMDSATIVRWLKQEGDAIAAGDVLAEVETDKTTTELESDTAGVVRKQLVQEGETVSVHQPVAIIGAADEDISALLLRVTQTAPAAHSHVERVYEAWHGNTPAPVKQNGHRASQPPITRTLESGLRRAGAPVPDAEAIRARLALRGAARPSITRTRCRIAIYGAGLGAKQLLEVTRQLNTTEVVGLIDDNTELAGTVLGSVPVLGDSSALADLAARGEIDGVALSFHSEIRRRVHKRIIDELGLRLVPLVDPRAVVGMEVEIGDGALIEAGAVVGPGTVVGEGTIVDVGAVVAHDCFLGPFSHLSPGACLSGVVQLTENVMVGVGASINSTVTIGRNTIIAPGAAVMNDMPDDVVVSGVPAKVVGHSRRGATHI